MNSNENTTDRFTNWYTQIEGRGDIDIQVLMQSFNNGVTPEEFNGGQR